MPKLSKIEKLIEQGYTQAAFRYKRNALTFATLWKKKGYSVRGLRSSGLVVEGGTARNAYNLVATKPKKRKK